ncbi:hypothetical protein DM860_016549 [Cuscuta australis]|uniref:Alcohol dehydrogenase-like C-terminal domain-containing protein n=1 Tax=Cuscuta australis TaxID=267555 RepID=A0A328E6G1_9ASTE|nr:hypothetical protein DM860_016549 [Cuscuta australis]
MKAYRFQRLVGGLRRGWGFKRRRLAFLKIIVTLRRKGKTFRANFHKESDFEGVFQGTTEALGTDFSNEYGCEANFQDKTEALRVHQSLRVTVISTSADKKQEAIERLGVDFFLISCDPEQMQATKSTLDGIIDTVSAVHPLTPLLSLLKTNGKLLLVGLPEKPLDLLAFPFIMG